MKALMVILTLILTGEVYASNSCFSNQEIVDLIKASKALDKCFASDDNNCKFKEKTIEEQKARNARRLIPLDRTLDGGFMDRTTGMVSAEFATEGYMVTATAQKISRCHIITSAHLLFADGKVSTQAKTSINFKTGQTCDSNNPFAIKTSASVLFKMTKEKIDFDCDRFDKYGGCERRKFYGHSDLVILKLDNYDKKDKSFFTLNTSNPSNHPIGQRVNCWGFPGHNENIKLTAPQSKMLLWSQKDAQIFGDLDGQSAYGVLTNAIAYHGMSGGGCVVQSNPRELVGLIANENSANGKSAINVQPSTATTDGANYLSAFHELDKRYTSETGKKLSDLDKECD